MIPEAYKEFIKNIIDLTDDGKVKWEEDTNDSFSLRTNNATVSLSHWHDDDREVDVYAFSYRNLSNKKEAGFTETSDDDDWRLMQRLYTVAAASANDIENELDSFLKGL